MISTSSSASFRAGWARVVDLPGQRRSPGAGVGGHFLEVGSDAGAKLGTPGLEGFLEAVKVAGPAPGDRRPVHDGGQVAAVMISGEDRGQPGQVGPGGVV